MEEDIVINVKNISKKFGLNFFKKNKKFALKDINFQVRKGESIGIVGVNGSGKSTLLQIIAGSLTPTSGEVEVFGKVGAILELGTGFHPDFTGEENAKLGLSMLGYNKKEIIDLVEDIKQFSELDDFFYEPVRKYSSGMFVRLAFATASVGKPDILIVDEALAVGDMSFQRKCYDRMNKLRSCGTALLFVSHDEEAVRTLTKKAILLNKGNQINFGPSEEIAFLHRSYMLSGNKNINIDAKNKKFTSDLIQMEHIELFNNNIKTNIFEINDNIHIRVKFLAKKDIQNINIGLRLRTAQGYKLYSCGTLNIDEKLWNEDIIAGQNVIVNFEFKCLLGIGEYEIQTIISKEKTNDYMNQEIISWQDDSATLKVIKNKGIFGFGGLVNLNMTYNYNIKE